MIAISHNIRKPNSRAVVSRNLAVQVVPNGVLTTIQFDNTILDRLNEFDIATNHRFDAAFAGDYLVVSQIQFLAVPVGTTIEMEVRTSDAGTIALDGRITAALGDAHLRISRITHLNAGSWVDTRVIHNNPPNLSIQNNDADTFMCIHRLGHE